MFMYLLNVNAGVAVKSNRNVAGAYRKESVIMYNEMITGDNWMTSVCVNFRHLDGN